MTLDRVSITLRGVAVALGEQLPQSSSLGSGGRRGASRGATFVLGSSQSVRGPGSWVPRNTNSREPLVSMAKPHPELL